MVELDAGTPYTLSGITQHSSGDLFYFKQLAGENVAKVYRREELGAGAQIAGPALIQEHGTTTVLFEHDRCKVAPSGELIVTIGGAR